ncbi:MAG TPA: carbohydrate kinase family protein [Verrucomicrobiae bacterium]
MLDDTAFRGSRLCIVGSICRDVKTSPIAPGDHLCHDGETPADYLVETIGGGGANSALFAAGLGAEVRFAGKVGTDALGAQLEQELQRRGVCSYVRRDPLVRTGSSIVLSYTNGCRHFISAQPNNCALDFGDLDLSMLDGTDHLLRADVWFSERMLHGGNAALLQAARDRGLATSLDLNWDPLWGVADAARVAARKEAVRRLLPLVTLVHGNVRELSLFADAPDLPTALERLTKWGAEAVVVHMGDKGAGFFSDDRLTVEPCVPVQRIVHTAGTGDLLSVCMMLLHACPTGSIAEKLRLANRVVGEFMEGRRDLLKEVSEYGGEATA